ncbi:MAG TPA: hypothetical protein VGF33_04555 [Caulobacteraceae bacterium]
MLVTIVALVLAQEIVPTAPTEIAPPPPPLAAGAPATPPAAPPAPVPPGDLSAAPPLPEGPLMPVARSEKGETFLVVNSAAKTGDVADFWTYEAFVPAIDIRPDAAVVQGLAHHQVNCASATDQTLASAGYDEGGVAIVALAAGPAASLVPDSAYALVAKVLCKSQALPTADATQGHAAALAAARQGAGG